MFNIEIFQGETDEQFKEWLESLFVKIYTKKPDWLEYELGDTYYYQNSFFRRFKCIAGSVTALIMTKAYEKDFSRLILYWGTDQDGLPSACLIEKGETRKVAIDEIKIQKNGEMRDVAWDDYKYECRKTKNHNTSLWFFTWFPLWCMIVYCLGILPKYIFGSQFDKFISHEFPDYIKMIYWVFIVILSTVISMLIWIIIMKSFITKERMKNILWQIGVQDYPSKFLNLFVDKVYK
jgi:hypothetical protein